MKKYYINLFLLTSILIFFYSISFADMRDMTYHEAILKSPFVTQILPTFCNENFIAEPVQEVIKVLYGIFASNLEYVPQAQMLFAQQWFLNHIVDFVDALPTSGVELTVLSQNLFSQMIRDYNISPQDVSIESWGKQSWLPFLCYHSSLLAVRFLFGPSFIFGNMKSIYFVSCGHLLVDFLTSLFFF